MQPIFEIRVHGFAESVDADGNEICEYTDNPDETTGWCVYAMTEPRDDGGYVIVWEEDFKDYWDAMQFAFQEAKKHNCNVEEY